MANANRHIRKALDRLPNDHVWKDVQLPSMRCEVHRKVASLAVLACLALLPGCVSLDGVFDPVVAHIRDSVGGQIVAAAVVLHRISNLSEPELNALSGKKWEVDGEFVVTEAGVIRAPERWRLVGMSNASTHFIPAQSSSICWEEASWVPRADELSEDSFRSVEHIRWPGPVEIAYFLAPTPDSGEPTLRLVLRTRDLQADPRRVEVWCLDAGSGNPSIR